jgi:aspartyl/asparaginyl beta-hydroxylase (cupin superfamily)/cytochrome c-type biogenesis protein CcmH/NrfG
MSGAAIAGAPSSDQRIRVLIASARQAAEGGRAHDADRLMRQAEREAPRHPLVLSETALRMARSGNPTGALALLQELARAEPENPEVLFNLATAFRAIDRVDDALAALEKLLTLEPGNVQALLQKGAVEELQGRTRAAAMTYRTVLQMMPSGFKPPPWMEPLLHQARSVVDANANALEAFIAQGLQDVRACHADQSLRRFDKCVDMMLQKRRIWRQQPTFMYFPELPAIEFYPRADFPWLDRIEAAADDIRAELLDVMSEGSTVLEPYFSGPQGPSAEQWRELGDARRWSVYSFWREGKPFPEHIARCPKTMAALDARPRWDVPGNGPTAMFSVLDARSRIPAHTGPINTRLVVHLALVVPPGCGFRVGSETREWQPGKAFVFDDSINHEAWNDSDLPRAVLIFDIWSPFLSPAERDLVRALTTRIGEFYGAGADGNAVTGIPGRA